MAPRVRHTRKHMAILRAAMQLFLQNGYARTSMDAIAAKAKVTKQTVYAHCHSKDALFADIIDALAKKHTPSSEPTRGKPAAVEVRLHELGILFLDMITSKEGLAAARLVIGEAYRHPKLAQRYYENGSRRVLIALADYLEEEKNLGRLHILVPMSAASYFCSMLKGNYYLRILLNIKPYPSTAEKESHVCECVEIFMRVYGGKNALPTRNVL